MTDFVEEQKKKKLIGGFYISPVPNYVVSLKMAIGSNKATSIVKEKKIFEKITIPKKLVSKQFINLNWDNVPPVESWQSI